MTLKFFTLDQFVNHYDENYLIKNNLPYTTVHHGNFTIGSLPSEGD